MVNHGPVKISHKKMATIGSRIVFISPLLTWPLDQLLLFKCSNFFQSINLFLFPKASSISKAVALDEVFSIV